MITSSPASTPGSGTSSSATTPSPLNTAARISGGSCGRGGAATTTWGATRPPKCQPRDAEDQQRRKEHDRPDGVDLRRHPELDLRIDVGRKGRLVTDREPGDDELV